MDNAADVQKKISDYEVELKKFFTTEQIQKTADEIIDLFKSWPQKENLHPTVIIIFNDLVTKIKTDPVNGIATMKIWLELKKGEVIII